MTNIAIQEMKPGRTQERLPSSIDTGGALVAAEPLRFSRRFCPEATDPYDTVEWDYRTAVIRAVDGSIVFEEKNIEVPSHWSQLATNVVVSKYFRGAPGSPDRENSVRQLIGRVADTISRWGNDDGYFATEGDAAAFRDDLTFLLLHQRASFNSPVWFNLGVEPDPQCSACFINSVSDSMNSIMDLAQTEARLFKFGSGSGVNLSTLRSSTEALSGGGVASGPLSFMRGLDAFAGAIKSGGKTRRAAKMVILDVDHPDIMDFVQCKAQEEKKACSLIDAGYDGSIDGEAYKSVFFQNSNNSVRVSDAFMKALAGKSPWDLRSRVSGETMSQVPASEIMDAMTNASHFCGDPGIQFDDTINLWNTCKSSGRINASNPCSEYMFLDDSACNLASLNLLKFSDDAGRFDASSFRAAVEIVFTAQEILVDRAGYPTEKIAENSHAFRPLGLGYANLGALLMTRGLPYDSRGGRDFAAKVTALMSGAAYAQSAKLAGAVGAFSEFTKNRDSMLDVIERHAKALEQMETDDLWDEAHHAWSDAAQWGELLGFRNAQATVLAPTGTIGFMMDCDTTGVEPDIALVKHKALVGGGTLEIINGAVPTALRRLGYNQQETQTIVDHISEHETIEGAPHLQDEHLSVFDCAFKPANGTRSIAPMGHIRMMAAVQPFLSGAISKTVNLPHEATQEVIRDVLVSSWKLGLKAVAVYRDGCKRVQPLTTKTQRTEPLPTTTPDPVRRRLPTERQAVTHKFSIAGHEGYMTVGLYEDGSPGEVFITMSKEGSTISGLMDSLATSVSIALQYGVPMEVLVRKFSHTRFEPSGFTGNPDIPMAKSIMDYLFRWLELKFLQPLPSKSGDSSADSNASRKPFVVPPTQVATETQIFVAQADAPTCADCGSLMVRNGACYKCCNCGSSSGCS